ncbi:MAG: hypothetical protein KGL59_15645, partial [Acidobacteriota bacterium]|nr:hypothetical protein [Acidobacteriota bacterium]
MARPEVAQSSVEKADSPMIMRKDGLFYRLVVLLAALFISGTPGWAANGSRKKDATPLYKVYAVRYGMVKNFPVSALVAGAPKGQRTDMAMMFWVLEGGGRDILVDAGFFHEQFIKS